MTHMRLRVLGALGAIALSGLIVAVQPAAADNSRTQHVLLLSVDGLHQSDLAWYIRRHPHSALAALVKGGVEFTDAQAPFPSDSFPGMVAQATGGHPKTTGVYYDDSYNRTLLPAGTKTCTGVAPGVEVTYFEALDKNPLSIDAGQGLSGLPGSILDMTSNPLQVIDPTQLPVDPTTCKPVFPNQYLKVNTMFEVARAAGLRTAWSDKHPAYEILSGPSGTGVQDLFTPEINSNASVSGAADWTRDNALTQIYDAYKVRSVINEIDGFDHSGRYSVGTPAIFGMNFQSVSTAEKLPGGGYQSDGVTPSAMLEGAFGYVDNQVAAMVLALKDRHLDGHTTIILSAKHGQSPDLPSALTRIDDGKIVDALNAAWRAAGNSSDLVAFAIDDDGWLMWTNDRSQAATEWAKAFLQHYSGTGTDVQGNPKAFTSAGLDPTRIYAGADAAAFIGVPFGDARVPDVIGVAQYGTVYTGGKGKIAEHGGDNPQDRDVPLVVSGGSVRAGVVNGSSVETTQIAPTILWLLGLNPQSLKAVQVEHTAVLPIGI